MCIETAMFSFSSLVIVYLALYCLRYIFWAYQARKVLDTHKSRLLLTIVGGSCHRRTTWLPSSAFA
jgi:hypothetical protein